MNVTGIKVRYIIYLGQFLLCKNAMLPSECAVEVSQYIYIYIYIYIYTKIVYLRIMAEQKKAFRYRKTLGMQLTAVGVAQRSLAWFLTLALGLRLGTKHDVIGPTL